MTTDGVLGAAYTPTDGQIDPARLCTALAAGARAAGVRIAQHTRVVGFATVDGPHGRRVVGVRTDRGDVECEAVVVCGGMYAAEIAALVDVRIPVVPMSHQYVVTAPVPGIPARLPSLRDPDLLVYYRQEIDGLVMGGYERRVRPGLAGPRAARGLQRQAARARTGTGSPRSPRTPPSGCPRWPTSGSRR